jgi:hypothetical protein
VAQIVELNSAVNAVVQAPAEQSLDHAGKTANHGIDFIRRYPSGYLTGVTPRAFHMGSGSQGKLAPIGHFRSAISASIHVTIEKTLEEDSVTPYHPATAIFTSRHSPFSYYARTQMITTQPGRKRYRNPKAELGLRLLSEQAKIGVLPAEQHAQADLRAWRAPA